MTIINPGMNVWKHPINKMGSVGRALVQERLEITRQFIEELHFGQTDKSGEDYWKHPYRVGLRIVDILGVKECDIHAALLHDIIEDTETTLEDLWQVGYPWQTLNIVDILTRDKSRYDRGATYQEWIKWIAKYGCWEARVIKYADILDNLSPKRSEGLSHGMKYRYQSALLTLEKSLDKKIIKMIIHGDL